MGKALDRLLELLDLEQIEVNIFRGVSPKERVQRVFGGPGRRSGAGRGRPHGCLRTGWCIRCTAYFIRPGDPVGAADLHSGPGSATATPSTPAG